VADIRRPPSVDAYGGGGFRVSGERVEGSILILNDAVRPWAVASREALTVDDLSDVLAAGSRAVEFLLLGIGPKASPAPAEVRKALQAAGMGLEVMDTATACRLYNVLAAEGRRLAAALIAI
jgi:uncharacterized protein